MLQTRAAFQPIDLGRLQNALRKEVLPVGQQALSMGGVGIIPNNDPVLRYLSQYGDERAYIAMEESEPKIYEAWDHRIKALLGSGTELRPGPSKSAAAKLLQEFGVEQLKRIRRWHDVQKLMLDARKWGWRPMQIILDTEATFKGRPAWFASKLVDQPPQRFRFTADGALVTTDGLMTAQEVISGERLELGWLLCTSGSIKSPYGTAIYRKIWFLWYLKNRFMQKFAQGMERSQGVLKAAKGFSITGEGVTPESNKAASEVVTELSSILDLLNQHNILVEMEGWKLDWLNNVSFHEGWLKALEYCDDAIQRAIVGETLTSDAGDRGTQALGTVHAGVRSDYAIDDAGFLEDTVDAFLEKMIRANFADVDPADLPKFHSHVKTRLDMQAVQQMYNMGAPIDGDRVAALTGVPLRKEDEAVDLVLQKPAGDALAGLLGAAIGNQGGSGPSLTEDERDEDERRPN